MVIDLNAELQKAREVVQLAKEAVEAKRQAAYALSIEETRARLTKEFAEVCKDYCDATWDEALNVARVPIDSAWRQPGSRYYHLDIREAPGAIPPPFATALESLEQPLAAQAALPIPEALEGSSQASDQSQRADEVADKGKGKEAKSSSVANDVAKANAKEAKAKAKKTDP